MTPFKHALIAIDFSETTEPLVQCAGDLEALGTERITLLHVQPVQYPAAPQLTHRETYEEHLKQLASGLEEIQRVAGEEDASLILVGRRGRGGLRDRFLGSAAENLSQQTQRPIMVLP